MKPYYQILLTLLLLSLMTACMAQDSRRVQFSQHYGVGEKYMSIRLLGMLQLSESSATKVNVQELSGLAWDEDEQLLYAVSDNGTLFHLKPGFDQDKLVSVEIAAAFPLLNKQGKPLGKRQRDSEGLAITGARNGSKGDSELIVSFEGNPRIKQYSPQGRLTNSRKVPAALRNKSAYQGPNKGLEAITYHPEYGLITAPETPLLSSKHHSVTLYGEKNRRWQFTGIPYLGGAVVALETLADGSVLLLERRFLSLLHPTIILLRRVVLADNCGFGQPPCEVETLAEFNSIDDWQVDNFEGLTHHQGNRYFMVSDNNQFWMQRTLLLYFEILR